MAIQRTVHFSGHVQGVGFRYTACRLAGGFDVVGIVKNLSDGRVELIVEGEPGEIDRFLDAIRSRMGNHIRNMQIIEAPASGRFNSFNVEF